MCVRRLYNYIVFGSFADPDLMKYAYTAESAKLLQSLLREPWRSDEDSSSSSSPGRHAHAPPTTPKSPRFEPFGDTNCHHFEEEGKSSTKDSGLESCLHSHRGRKLCFDENDRFGCDRNGSSTIPSSRSGSYTTPIKERDKLSDRSLEKRVSINIPCGTDASYYTVRNTNHFEKTHEVVDRSNQLLSNESGHCSPRTNNSKSSRVANDESSYKKTNSHKYQMENHKKENTSSSESSRKSSSCISPQANGEPCALKEIHNGLKREDEVVDSKFNKLFPREEEKKEVDGGQLIDFSDETPSSNIAVDPATVTSPRDSTLKDLEDILNVLEKEDDSRSKYEYIYIYCR